LKIVGVFLKECSGSEEELEEYIYRGMLLKYLNKKMVK
jgi:hypothetical protein